MESKKEIYDLIPPEYYPKTILIQPNDDLETIFGKRPFDKDTHEELN